MQRERASNVGATVLDSLLEQGLARGAYERGSSKSGPARWAVVAGSVLGLLCRRRSRTLMLVLLVAAALLAIYCLHP